ncbi:hypothetical protein NQZ68_000446 [Dissostichus eleginoides]|nr:hypothetical protein NQZ68_000446 [Dissostichus eleginoides]
MEDSPHLYISEFVENEHMDKMEINQEETNIASDMVKSPYQDTERDSNSFQCQHCERHFTTKPGLERHMHIHTSANNDAHKYKTNISLASNLEQLHHEKVKPLDLAGSAMQLHTSPTTGSNTPILSSGDHNAQPDKPGVSEGRHACKYCEKIFTTQTNKRRHERRIHEQHLQVTHVEKAHLPQEENVEGMCSETNQQETELVDKMAPAAVLENENTEGTVVQKERTVFLSPKLKQLLEKQDGLKLALIADGQKPLSPVSLSVLPAGTGRFKRRTGSPPPSSPQQSPREETADSGDCEAVNTGQTETQHSSTAHQTANVKDDTTPPEEEPQTESWPPSTGGNSCNQQPLDLSNTVKSTIFTVHHSIHHPCFTHRALHCSFINHSVGSVTYFKPTNPECTIALEAPGSIVPAAVNLQENTAEPPAPTQMVVNHVEQEQIVSVPNPQTEDPTILMSSIAESVTLSTTASVLSDCPAPVGESGPEPELVVNAEPWTIKEEEAADSTVSAPEIPSKTSPSEKAEEEDASTTPSDAQQQTFTKNFICNVCDKLFHSMKELGHHVGDHADEWPYKCEFCVLLFSKPSALLDHRSSLHGVGKTYVCSACTKEFVYLCNLKQHQEELHPGQQCTYTEDEKGKLRPQNYNNLTKVNTETSVPDAAEEPKVKKEEGEVDEAAEELLTTIKIMASDGAKFKGPDVRLGINQHYPSYKPPPFPYHNRSTTGTLASATNFTTHNIPQTFSTAIRCTKCGKSFDNMPELHKHILTCANASDKRRYTPKRNPIPLRHFAKTQNGVLSTTNSTNGLNASNRPSQSNRSKPNQDSAVNVKFKVLSKRKKKLVQRVMPQRNKSVPSSNKMSPAHVDEQQEIFVCPHCSREFTMRRSRTKHMAVCPKKPKEVKKRKEGGISVTKENDGHLHRGPEETQQSSPLHKTRLQTSSPAKRPAILPVQTVLSNKRSKIIIKESTQLKQDTPTLSELPIVRTFNPSMRQYSRMQHSVEGMPIKITIVKPQQAAAQREERPPTPGPEDSSSSEHSPAV